MSVEANLNMLVNVIESFTEDALVNQSVTHSGYNLTGIVLNSTSTPPITMASLHDYALTAGTITIDLSALAGLNDVVQDATGLKLQLLLFINAANNAAMTITGEGANGYSLGGAAHVISGGTQATRTYLYWPEALGDVGASDKLLVVTGTGTQAFKLALLLG